MFGTILLEQQINKASQEAIKQIQLLIVELDKANKRIADLERRVNWLYNEDLP